MTLKEAISLAARAHSGQFDDAGAPYILHAMRVMLAQDTAEARLVAILHDVVEDSSVTLDDLRDMGLSPEATASLSALTRGAEEPYAAYIDRVAQDPIATKVAIADIRDKLDTVHLGQSSDDGRALRRIYYKALNKLEGTVEPSSA